MSGLNAWYNIQFSTTESIILKSLFSMANLPPALLRLRHIEHDAIQLVILLSIALLWSHREQYSSGLQTKGYHSKGIIFCLPEPLDTGQI